MARTITRPMSARFMVASIPLNRRLMTARAPGAQEGDVQVLQRRLLQAFELDERLAVVQDRLELVALRGREIALREDHVVVRRHADLELALLGLERLLRELASGLRRLNALDAALDVDR